MEFCIPIFLQYIFCIAIAFQKKILKTPVKSYHFVDTKTTIWLLLLASIIVKQNNMIDNYANLTLNLINT